MNKKQALKLVGRDLRLSPIPLTRTWTQNHRPIPHWLNVWRVEAVKKDAFELTNAQGYHFDLGFDHCIGYTSPNTLELRSQLVCRARELTVYPLRVYRWDAPPPLPVIRRRGERRPIARPEITLPVPLLVTFALGLFVGATTWP